MLLIASGAPLQTNSSMVDRHERSIMHASRIAAAAFALALALITGSARAAPPNDTCASAQVITVAALNTPQTITGTNQNATSDLAGSGCSIGDDLDVWYALTATVAGNYTFDTIDGLLNDTTLAAYSSCGGTQLACNDDIDLANGVTWSRITLALSVGQSIRIRVAGYNGAEDAFNLNIVATVPPTNDSCESPQTIALDQIKAGNTAGAITNVDLDAASCGTHVGSGGGKDVFYSFTPPATGAYSVSLCDSSFDTVLAVLRDCTGTIESIVACNDNSTACVANTSASNIPAVTLTGGVMYLVRVAGYVSAVQPASGNYTLVIHSNTPASGVCCRGSTCNTTIAQASCVGSGTAGARFVSGAMACGALLSTTPCCHADYNKLGGITVTDIFDYLNDWFAGSIFAIVGGNGSSGTLTVQAIFDYLNAWFMGGC